MPLLSLRAYKPASYPQLEAGVSTYISSEFAKIASALSSLIAGINSALGELRSFREQLTAARDYYVATTGDDANDGLTALTPFLTIQKAINVASALDLSIYSVTIHIADGTYTGAVQCKSYVGVGPITLLGNTTTPSNVLLSVTNSPVIQCSQVQGVYQVNGMRLQANTDGHNCIIVSQNSQLGYSNIVFGKANIHVSCTYNGIAIANTNTKIDDVFNIHWYVDTGGMIQDAGKTITITGTPAIGQAFAFALQHGRIICNQNTFSGSATGGRFSIAQLALINSGSGDRLYLPGSVDPGNPPYPSGSVYV